MWSATHGCQSKCSLGPVTSSNNKAVVAKTNVDSEREKNIAFAAGLLVGAGYTVEKCSNVNGFSPQPYYFSPYANNAKLPAVGADTVYTVVFTNVSKQGSDFEVTGGENIDEIIASGQSVTVQIPAGTYDVNYAGTIGEGSPFEVTKDTKIIFDDDGVDGISVTVTA